MSMTGREGPVDPGGPRLFRHDPGDGGGGLHVVHRGQGQRVRHLGPEGQAHPAAFKVGADEVGDGGRGAQGVQRVEFRRRVGTEELGHPGGGKGGDPLHHLGSGAKADMDEQLPHLRRLVHPRQGGTAPSHAPPHQG